MSDSSKGGKPPKPTKEELAGAVHKTVPDLVRPGLRVLYTSGSPLTTEMTELFVGGSQFLQKPYSSKQLEFSVGELLH